MQLTLGEGLRLNSIRYPEKVAAVYNGVKFTFKELNERVNRLANGFLERGLRKGDKVSILMYNCNEYLEVYYGLGKAGLVAVPINYRLTREDIKRTVVHSDSVAFLYGTEFSEIIESLKPKLTINDNCYIEVGAPTSSKDLNYEAFLEGSLPNEPEEEVKETDLCLIGYTSGTTGNPKGVLWTHRRWVLQFLFNGALDMGFTKCDKALIAGPFYSGYCFVPLCYAYLGATQYIMKNFDPNESLKIIDQEDISMLFAAPTMFTMILSQRNKRKYEVSSVKKLASGMAPLMSETKRQILDFFQEAELFEVYSSMEIGFGTILRPEDQLVKTRCVGLPATPVNIRLLDETGREVPPGEIGELWARSPFTFAGYYKMEEMTKQATRGEWVTSGDLARQDEQGYYYIVDRKKDMIITGGLNVYPIEIDEAISQHPDVLESATIGVPDLTWGEAIKSIVVLRADTSCTEQEIIDYCTEKLARYKIPRSVDFIDTLPKNAAGKILKKELRKSYWVGYEA